MFNFSFRYGRRKLELFFAFLILVMGVSFGINYGADVPPQDEVALGVVKKSSGIFQKMI
jgi:hypothetical protein